MGNQNSLTVATPTIIDKLIGNQSTKRVLVIQVIILHFPDAFSLILPHWIFINISIYARTRGRALVLRGKALVTGYSIGSAPVLKRNIMQKKYEMD